MNCPYASNAFCAALTEPTREALCRGCSLKRYPEGYSFSVREFSSGWCLIAEGFLIYEKARPGARASGKTIDLPVRGSFGCVENTSPFCFDDSHRLYCMKDAVIATFNGQAVERLKRVDRAFSDSIYKNLLNFTTLNHLRFLEHVGFGSAEEAVGYVIGYLGGFGIRNLTHKQLAQICNLQRPTVTRVMQNLTRSEPELFQIKEKTD